MKIYLCQYWLMHVLCGFVVSFNMTSGAPYFPCIRWTICNSMAFSYLFKLHLVCWLNQRLPEIFWINTEKYKYIHCLVNWIIGAWSLNAGKNGVYIVDIIPFNLVLYCSLLRVCSLHCSTHKIKCQRVKV